MLRLAPLSSNEVRGSLPWSRHAVLDGVGPPAQELPAMTRPSRLHLLFVLALAMVSGACGEPPVTPAPSLSPSPSAVVLSPGAGAVPAPEAAAAALAADPRFVGFAPLNLGLAGQRRWYEMTADGNSWNVVVTFGWGACDASCERRHSWHYRIGPDGIATLASESGGGLPPESFPTPDGGIAQYQLVTALTGCPDGDSCPPSVVPGARLSLDRWGSDDPPFELSSGPDGRASGSLPGGVYILNVLSRPDGGPLPPPFAISLAPGETNLIAIAFGSGG